MQIQKEGFAGEGESGEEIEISDEELKKIEAEVKAEAEAEDKDKDEDEDEEMPPMAKMPTAEPYMSEISFAPSPKNGKKSMLGSLDLSMDAQAAPIVSDKKKSGKYTSCKCADGNEIMLMR